ncbi:hypothetical protein EYZ11_013193 [Aspergillus tanneri]|uniref:Xylanolytic transcriptional activator regulatory domain-containing protein n=1 Tax=Aspergillus tanneri TaxID=1220188 RepID=A0A4S3J3Q5_9EURO|nr:hypothetical protein EYZ11_013193 [Aspergillus tanneri]
MFQDTIVTAYSTLDDGRLLGKSSAQALPLDSIQYMTAAQSLLPRILLETASVEGLQSLCMLAFIEQKLGDVQAAMYFTSLAARLIFGLRAYVFSEPDLSTAGWSASTRTSSVQPHLRSLFWLCFAIDKELSLQTGEPPSINDDVFAIEHNHVQS